MFCVLNYRPDTGLVELLWQNGQVVLSSQKHKKQGLISNECRQVHKQSIKGVGSCVNSSHLIQDDETVSWLQSPIEDTFDKDFYSAFFSELPVSGPVETDKPIRQQVEEEKMVKLGAVTSSQPLNVNHSVVPGFQRIAMPPPRSEFDDSLAQQNNKGLVSPGKVVNFSQKGELGCDNAQFGQKRAGNLPQQQGGEVRECSVMTVGSSHCGSNQVVYDPDVSRASRNTGVSPGSLKDDTRPVGSKGEKSKTETLEPAGTSSSGGSGSSFNRTSKQSTGDNSNKRKSRDVGESECQSEVERTFFASYILAHK